MLLGMSLGLQVFGRKNSIGQIKMLQSFSGGVDICTNVIAIQQGDVEM